MKSIAEITAQIDSIQAVYGKGLACADKSTVSEYRFLQSARLVAQLYESQRDPVADLQKLREKMEKRNDAWYSPAFNNARKEWVAEERKRIDEHFNTSNLRIQIRLLEYLLS